VSRCGTSYYPGICLVRLRKTIDLSQDSWSLDRYFNLWPPEYEAGMLTIRTRRRSPRSQTDICRVNSEHRFSLGITSNGVQYSDNLVQSGSLQYLIKRQKHPSVFLRAVKNKSTASYFTSVDITFLIQERPRQQHALIHQNKPFCRFWLFCLKLLPLLQLRPIPCSASRSLTVHV
jgi:hypothetical protein